MNYRGFIWAGIFVEDLKASIKFYKDLLDLPLLGEGADWAHFDAGNGSLLELFSGGTARQVAKPPDQQSIVLGLRVDDLDSAIAELKRRGIQFTDDVGEFEGARWAHFLDLEGNRLEIKEIP
jgi:predicted enzyme related to lactoylglutathione lyase